MKERGWDRRLVVSQRGPTTKAEPFVGGFPPFVPAFRFFCVPSTITTAGIGSSSRDPEANRSVLLCVKAKIKKKGCEPPFPAPRGKGEVECHRRTLLGAREKVRIRFVNRIVRAGLEIGESEDPWCSWCC